MASPCFHVLIGCSGSVATIKLPKIIEALAQRYGLRIAAAVMLEEDLF
jgi:hypothetical protein